VGHEAVEVATRSGNVEWMGLAQANLAMARWAVGEWDAVVSAQASETVHADMEAGIATLARLVLVARGQDPSQTTLQSARRAFLGYWWTLGTAIAQAFTGDPEAIASARAAHDDAYEENRLDDDYPAVFAVVMDIGLKYADHDLLLRLAQVVDDAGALPQTGLRGHRALLGARMASPEDASERVEGLFTTALQEYDAWGSPVYLARARAAYGAWLSRRGRLAEAEPLLSDARTTYAALGATAWLAELEEALSEDRVGS
jgi:hypothetical protein